MKFRLNENITRIKQIMRLINEQEEELITKNSFQISSKYDPNVEELQKFLKYQKKYDIGKSGKNKDGIDGIYGKLTQKAHQQYNKGIPPETKEKQNIDISFDKSNADVVFVGGLEKDMNLNSQVNLLKRGLKPDRKVKAFHYYDSDEEINNFLDENPNSVVYLFSAGANKIVSISNNPNVNLSDVYIIEPYTAKQRVLSRLESAISKGLPRQNVFHGGSVGRGSAFKGATASGGSNHFTALTSVANKT